MAAVFSGYKAECNICWWSNHFELLVLHFLFYWEI